MATKQDSTQFYREAGAASRYSTLEQDRETYLQRAVNNAKLTIPMLFPDKNDTATTEYETPYQSIGARGVNNLCAKLMKALFPPNEPFFRLQLGTEIQEEVDAQQANTVKLDEVLAMMERRIMNYMETERFRITLSEAVLQLLVAGNVLLYVPPEGGGIKMYRLSNYVVVRDGLGNWIEVVVKERAAYAALPDEARECVKDTQPNPDTSYDLYTHVYLKDNETYAMYQELEGAIINGSEAEFPKDKVPWMPLRLRKMDNESYGRSYVDEYYGDLKTLNALSKAVTEMAAIASFVLFLVNPSSTLRIDKLKDAQSGDFFKGKEGDITAFQLNKLNDLNIVVPQIQDLQSRLSFAFLINSAVQRQAERVTAEEIRYVASELEDTVGSIYSLLSVELQRPLVSCVMAQVMRNGSIPDMEIGAYGIEAKIVTGVEALGRGYDLSKMEQLLQVTQLLPSGTQRLKEGNILTAAASSIGLDGSQFVKSDEELQAELMQAQQMALEQQVAAPVADNLTQPTQPAQQQQVQQ